MVKSTTVRDELGMVPDALEHTNMPEEGTSGNRFEIGMRLEAKDLQNPTLVCVAHVEDIRGNEVKISFDEWDSKYDYWTEYYSTNLHPIGYCKHVKVTNVCAPGKTNGENFDWNDYLLDNELKPAPADAFSDVQSLGCPPFEPQKHRPPNKKPVVIEDVSRNLGKAQKSRGCALM